MSMTSHVRAVGAEAPLPQRAMFEIYSEQFDTAIAEMIDEKIELSLIVSLTNHIVRGGDRADEEESSSGASIARFHSVCDLTLKLIVAGENHSKQDRIVVKLLVVLRSLIEQKSLNFGVLQLYGDSSFFELTRLVLVFCSKADCRKNKKFPGRVAKFFTAFLECFDYELLPLESWEFIFSALADLFPVMNATDARTVFALMEAVVGVAPDLFARVSSADQLLRASLDCLERRPRLEPAFAPIASALSLPCGSVHCQSRQLPFD
jgi:hypothetical protein